MKLLKMGLKIKFRLFQRKQEAVVAQKQEDAALVEDQKTKSDLQIRLEEQARYVTVDDASALRKYKKNYI